MDIGLIGLKGEIPDIEQFKRNSKTGIYKWQNYTCVVTNASDLTTFSFYRGVGNATITIVLTDYRDTLFSAQNADGSAAIVPVYEIEQFFKSIKRE